MERDMRIGLVAIICVMAVVAAVATAAQERGGGQRAGGAAGPAMTMTVAGFVDGGQFPVKNSQAAEGAAPGEGPSPAITWANVPAGTQSFVLHMHDMDLARNRTTDDQPHWVVWNIPPTATGLPEAAPKGNPRADGSFQISATGPVYRGPGAPATGPMHHYVFELFALDAKIDVPPGTNAEAAATRAAVMKGIEGHALGKAVLVGRFHQ